MAMALICGSASMVGQAEGRCWRNPDTPWGIPTWLHALVRQPV